MSVFLSYMMLSGYSSFFYPIAFRNHHLYSEDALLVFLIKLHLLFRVVCRPVGELANLGSSRSSRRPWLSNRDLADTDFLKFCCIHSVIVPKHHGYVLLFVFLVSFGSFVWLVIVDFMVSKYILKRYFIMAATLFLHWCVPTLSLRVTKPFSLGHQTLISCLLCDVSSI